MVEAVNTACYVQNRVLVVKHHNKTPYELFMVEHQLKSFRVFNSRKKIVEENLHIRFSENTPNVVGSEPDWLFDIDALTRTMNYEPISSHDDGFKPSSDDGKKVDEDPRNESECKDHEKEDNVNSTYNVNTISLTINVAGINRANAIGELSFDPDMPALEDVGTFDFSNEDEDDDAVADMNNLDTTIQVSPTPTIRIHKDHPLVQVIRDLHSTTQTRNMSKNLEEHGFVSSIHQRENHKDLQNCLLACFLLQKEPKKVSSMGELTFFLGLQVKQKNDGIFISQDKYVVKIQKKFTFIDAMNASTPIKTQKPLLKDEDGKEVDVLMYRYQVNLKVSHLHAVKRIFRYLKGQPKLCLWYLKDSSFDLVAYTDSDYARASLDRKSTTREQFWPTAVAKTINGKAKIHTQVDGKKVISEASTIRDLQFADEEGVSCLPNSTIFEQLASIGSQGTDSGGGPRCQEAMRDTTAQTRVIDLEKTKTTQANEIDNLKRRTKKLERRNKSRTHALKRLYKVGLTTRVESSDNEESLGDDTSKQGRRIDDIDANEDITLVNVQADAEMFDADNDLGCEEVFVEQEVVADKEKINEVTLAQALAELKTSKPKAKGVVIQDPSESSTTITIIPKQKS
nr:hypothetical protein [Tanacetum cinerariifolium]